MSSRDSPADQWDWEDDPLSSDDGSNAVHNMYVPNNIGYNRPPPTVDESAWKANYGMQVPERILVAGREQHIGTRAPPREIAFDNSTMPGGQVYPGEPRVATPPRTLTLDRYPFPARRPESPAFEPKSAFAVPTPVKRLDRDDDNFNLGLSTVHNDSMTLVGVGQGLTVSDEVLHLRREMAKLNRKVMALEQEHANFLHKEKLLYMAGIAYLLFKAVLFLNRL